jgi:hypothetical protein
MSTWSKRAPWAGIIAVALLVAAFIIGGETPDIDDSTQKIVDFYSDNDTEQFIAGIVLGYSALFTILFAGALRGRLRKGEGDMENLSSLSFAGAVLIAIGMTVFAGLSITLADLGKDAEPATAQALNALNSDMFVTLAVGTSLFLITTGLGILRSGALPRWMGWVAFVIGLTALTPAGFFAFLLAFVWILIASIVMLRGEPAAST